MLTFEEHEILVQMLGNIQALQFFLTARLIQTRRIYGSYSVSQDISLHHIWTICNEIPVKEVKLKPMKGKISFGTFVNRGYHGTE